MSADQFDPQIERLFARHPVMADADVFAQSVDARLSKGGRLRAGLLWSAAGLGGVVAVREMMGVSLTAAEADGIVAGDALGEGLRSSAFGVQSALQAGLDRVGLGDGALAAVGGMQLFWISAAVIIGVAALGAMRLSQEI